MVQSVSFSPSTAFAQPCVVRAPQREDSLVDTFSRGVDRDRSIGEGAATGAAIGSGFGTIIGAVAGGLGTIGMSTYKVATLGSTFGLVGTLVGGAVGFAGATLEERYLGLGTKAGSIVGFAVGGAVGGAIGGAIGVFT